MCLVDTATYCTYGDARRHYSACYDNNLDRALQLLQKGVDTNHSYYNRVWIELTHSHWACQYNYHRLVQTLIQQGVGLDAVDH